MADNIEREIESHTERENAFFGLAERLRTAQDPEEIKQLGDQIGPLVFGE
jgi:hypothetical protein